MVYQQNYVKIIDINDEVLETNFNEYCDSEWFHILDKDLIGQWIGRNICDEIGSKICVDGYNYNENIIYNYIDEMYINQLRNEIFNHVESYLDHNVCDCEF